jgi:hypothetical protein
MFPAKNLLTRIQMLHHIRDKIQPHAGQAIPTVLGNTPASWWGDDEDRDLMIGIMKYGYGINHSFINLQLNMTRSDMIQRCASTLERTVMN